MIYNSMNVYPVGCSSKYAQGALGHTVSMSTWSMSLCCTTVSDYEWLWAAVRALCI